MNSILLAVLLGALAPAVSFGQSPLKSSTPSDQWTIQWSASDEFNDASPNWKKWVKKGNLPNTSSWTWDNSQNISHEDGIAVLTLRHNSNNAPLAGTYFNSAILKSYRTFTYGYFEARLKGAAFPGSGVCPAFWLYSNFNDKVSEGETIYSEIDVVELQQFDWYLGKQDDVHDLDLNLHCVLKKDGKRQWRRPKAFPDEQLNKWKAPWDPRDDFHVYGVEVTPSEIIWFVDGEEVARKPNLHWHRPMHLALSLGLRKPFVTFENNRNNAADPKANLEAEEKLPHLPVSMQVDYVRVWQRAE